ncbi:hypothetical protein BU23DRAFT_573363 [Bimuria novae-zelandiae CBS 107.79]|uniref:Uncharacterized protein n=1 Tax=Bimuria novae-zelandiae CBS 107.79 TaxID=1447943 RepID=A0A6A5UQM6_9PLEO|nr:hypothetical protein BU23DRAFT_573363 [Bimuria novae-zelandiae CBS 107.79]
MTTAILFARLSISILTTLVIAMLTIFAPLDVMHGCAKVFGAVRAFVIKTGLLVANIIKYDLDISSTALRMVHGIADYFLRDDKGFSSTAAMRKECVTMGAKDSHVDKARLGVRSPPKKRLRRTKHFRPAIVQAPMGGYNCAVM